MIATFLKSETSPLAQTSLYVDWQSLQQSPLPPGWPVWSGGAKVTNWHSVPLVEITAQLVQGTAQYTSILK